MAGIFQTLILTPSPSKTLLFYHRTTTFNRSRSISIPIRACQLSNQVLSLYLCNCISSKAEGNGSKAPKLSDSAKGLLWANPLLSFAANNFLPLALIGGVALGLANPTLGCLADKYYLSKFSTFGIFVISGLTLRSGEIGSAMESWPVGIFGLVDLKFLRCHYAFCRFILHEFLFLLTYLFPMFCSNWSHSLLAYCCWCNHCYMVILVYAVLHTIFPLLFKDNYANSTPTSRICYRFGNFIFLFSNSLYSFMLCAGLAIFSCMPTTLSSGVALTQLAGGNSALALAITVISNLLGILIVPFSVSKFIADGVGVFVPTKQLFRNLVLTLLIPLMLGKVLRESFKGFAEFVDQNRKHFSKISAILLSLVPWIQVSRSRSLLLTVKPMVFLVAIGMGTLLHLILLTFNALAIQSLSAVSGGDKSVFAKKENADAVLLVASQKTLPVMVAVVEQLGGAFGGSGLLVLPCVAAHLNQIIIDSFLVNFWLRKDLSSNKVKVA
ncbi:LOW QUALITY PROTEIN: DUF4137 domain-containing protein [Cephalotus follicularis]|uniref:Probable sodium/metabolite cotransporter BASS4, chloroplastic n=1 Tax=Cephalotus follicularis TaxID=3775 RepID=A0A1Q3AX02_CEPFO|nr:LOW QUALITY PROTEIN: DUF4137 domain-containing protein [Cephalotus follicularis]